MLNKRGQGLQVSTVILIILALLVLVILAVIVTGGFAEFAEKLGIIKSTTLSLDEARLQCQGWCNTRNSEKYCSGGELSIDTDGDREPERHGCTDVLIGVSCSQISCTGG